MYDDRVAWPWRRRSKSAPPRNWTLTDPEAVRVLTVGGAHNYSGAPVTEATALGLSAVYRAVSLISGTIAGLPMRTIREVEGERTHVRSIFDAPGGRYGPTPFEWRETLLIHLLLHGNAFIRHIRNAIGALVALELVHPLCVRIEREDFWPGRNQRPVLGGKLFHVTLEDGSTLTLDAADMTHIPSMSTDGLRGLSPIAVARNSLGTAIAADRAAANLFGQGLMASYVAVPEFDDFDPERDAKVVKRDLRAKAAGWENAGEIPVLTRRIKLERLTMAPEDAQFLESRVFQIEEIARWYGLPAFMLTPEKQTSWGTGVAEQFRGLARYTLRNWTGRIEDRCSRILTGEKFIEFDFAGLMQGTPEEEIRLLLEQVEAGVLSKEEFRAIRNMGPMDPTHTFVTAPTPTPPTNALRARSAVDDPLRELVGAGA